MDETTLLEISLVLMVVPLPLVLYGVLEGISLLWWVGIVLMVVGGLIPPVTRYVFEGEGNGEDDKDDENGQDEAAAD